MRAWLIAVFVGVITVASLAGCSTTRLVPQCPLKVEWPAETQKAAAAELDAHPPPELMSVRESLKILIRQRRVLDACRKN